MHARTHTPTHINTQRCMYLNSHICMNELHAHRYSMNARMPTQHHEGSYCIPNLLRLELYSILSLTLVQLSNPLSLRIKKKKLSTMKGTDFVIVLHNNLQVHCLVCQSSTTTEMLWFISMACERFSHCGISCKTPHLS